MIYMSAATLLYELRSIRTALEEHNKTLCSDPVMEFVAVRVNSMVREIEDATYLQVAPDIPPAEAGLG